MSIIPDTLRAHAMNLESRNGEYAEIVNPPKGFAGDMIDRFGPFKNVAKEFVFDSGIEKETLDSIAMRSVRDKTPFYVPVRYEIGEEGTEELDIFVVDPISKKVTFCSSSDELMLNLIDKKTQTVFDQIRRLAQDYMFTVKV